MVWMLPRSRNCTASLRARSKPRLAGHLGLTNDFRGLVPMIALAPFFWMQSGRGERKPYCQTVGQPGTKAMGPQSEIDRYKTCLCVGDRRAKKSSSDPHAKGAVVSTAPLPYVSRRVRGLLAVGLAAVVNDQCQPACRYRARDNHLRRQAFGLKLCAEGPRFAVHEARIVIDGSACAFWLRQSAVVLPLPRLSSDHVTRFQLGVVSNASVSDFVCVLPLCTSAAVPGSVGRGFLLPFFRSWLTASVAIVHGGKPVDSEPMHQHLH